MVTLRYRSKRMRKVHTKLPGGKVVPHYSLRNVGKPQCRMCGVPLQGVVRGRVSQAGKFTKSERKPERPYGGVLCTKCMRKTMIERARKLVA